MSQLFLGFLGDHGAGCPSCVWVVWVLGIHYQSGRGCDGCVCEELSLQACHAATWFPMATVATVLWPEVGNTSLPLLPGSLVR